LTLEEKSIKSKYELAENLKIGLTDINRKEKVDKIYDYSVNDETLSNLSKRISAVIHPDIQAEIDANTKRGIIFKHQSIFLECEVFKKLYGDIKDKEFTKADIHTEIINDIQILRKHSESFEFRDQILKTKGFNDLMQIGIQESIAIEYAYSIASGDIDTIFSLDIYKRQSEKISNYVNSQLDKLEKKVIRIKSRSTLTFSILLRLYTA